jgi:peptide/nickel transport system permease protein
MTHTGPPGMTVDAATEMTPDVGAGGAAGPAPPAGRRSWSLWLAVGWFALITLLAVLANWLPIEPYDELTGKALLRPGWRWPEFLGTDELGRSMLSRIVYGARVSLVVGVVATALALVIGGALGMMWGYLRGPLGPILAVVTDAMLAFPGLILLLAATAVVTPNTRNLALILGVLVVPAFARLARGSTMAAATNEYVTVARTIGATNRRIIVREILPNIVPPLTAYAFIVMATLIVAEGSLSFLGLGIRPPQPSWGGLIASGRTQLDSYPYLTFVPALTLLFTVLALNVIGDHMRRRLQTRESVLS